jgi:hypothetical protein
LTDLAGNERELLDAHPEDIDLDVQAVVGTPFGAETPRDDIEVLESLDDGADRTRVGIG